MSKPKTLEAKLEKAQALVTQLEKQLAGQLPTDTRPTLGVDFDGTLCEFAYPGIGAPKEGAKQALEIARAIGYRIVIWTCRTCHYNYDIFGGDPAQHTLDRDKVKEMTDWLKVNDIPYDEIDDGSRGKLHADFYIDDKAIAFQNNWSAIGLALHQLAAQKQQQAAQAVQAQQGAAQQARH